MLDGGSLSQALREVLAGYPVARPVLRRLADRLMRTGAFSGRMKIGEWPSGELLSALGRILPNAALDVRSNGEVSLRLDRAGISPEEADGWIDALCVALEVPRVDARARRVRMEAESAGILDRCRLQYPDLGPVWESLQAASPPAREDLFRLAEAVGFLMGEHDPLGLADVGARFFGDSKALKASPSLARRLEEWLLILREEEIREETRRRVWADCGVVENATALKVTLFGPVSYRKYGEGFDWIARLHALGEAVTLSWDNLQGIESIALPPDTPVITCENETPFASLVRTRTAALVIYTAGYPNATVLRLLGLLPDDSVGAIRHWGDSDLDGLRIASILGRSRPVCLWRCDLSELRRHRELLLPLTPERRQRAEAFLAKHPDFAFAEELSLTIEYGWLEQESWRDPGDGGAAAERGLSEMEAPR